MGSGGWGLRWDFNGGLRRHSHRTRTPCHRGFLTQARDRRDVSALIRTRDRGPRSPPAYENEEVARPQIAKSPDVGADPLAPVFAVHQLSSEASGKGIEMNYYAMEFLAKERMAEARREADEERLARMAGASRAAANVTVRGLRRLVARVAPAT